MKEPRARLHNPLKFDNDILETGWDISIRL